MRDVIKSAITIKNFMSNASRTTCNEYLYEALQDALESMDKQIPKEITHESTLRASCTCPRCKNVMDRFERFGDSRIRVRVAHCHFCGQSLDWGDI